MFLFFPSCLLRFCLFIFFFCDLTNATKPGRREVHTPDFWSALRPTTNQPRTPRVTKNFQELQDLIPRTQETLDGCSFLQDSQLQQV